jgi:hypothetical protein
MRRELRLRHSLTASWGEGGGRVRDKPRYREESSHRIADAEVHLEEHDVATD